MSAQLLNKYENKSVTFKYNGRDGTATLVHELSSGQYALVNIKWVDQPLEDKTPILLTKDMVQMLQEIGGTLVLIYPRSNLR